MTAKGRVLTRGFVPVEDTQETEYAQLLGGQTHLLSTEHRHLTS